MSITFMLIPLISLLLIGIYLLFFLIRIISEVLGNKNKLHFILAAIILAIVAGLGIYFTGFTAIIVILHLFIIAAIVQLIHFVLRKFITNYKAASKINKVYNLGILPIALTIVVMALGYWNMTNIVETDFNMTTDKLDAGESIKVAMMADTHLSNAINADDLIQYVDVIQDAKPDVLVLVGDIFDEGTSREDMEKACKVLGSIDTKDGIYFVYGNHDKATYGGNPNYTEEDVEKALTDAGIVIVNDQSLEFENFVLVGRMDYSGDLNHNPRKPLEELLMNVDASKFILDLDHQPQETAIAAELGVDLQLSGHTHGGQIWPAGQLNKVFHFNDFEYGHGTIGDFNIFVTSGMSGWGMPIRTEKRSEFVIINITGK